MPIIRKIALLMCFLSLVGGCASGRTAFSKGQKLEQEGKLDEAVVRYADAAVANPEISEYRLQFLKVSEKAARMHLERGDAFFSDEKYDDALKEYQTAVALDASLDKARQQSELVVKIQNSLVYYKEGEDFEKASKLREALRSYQKALSLDPDNVEAQEALERLKKSKPLKIGGFELNLKSTKPITLKFANAKLKDVFNILGKLSGINFIFDDTVKDVNYSIFLENATFQQALDIMTNINKLNKKVLNENTIIIYPKSPDKTKQYEELMVETYYLNKLDAKKAVNLIRTMLQVKKVYVNEEMNALVIRDTPDTLEVARKILDANDVPDAELVLEVEVIEIAKSNEDKFGLALSQYAVSTAAWTPGQQMLSDTLNPATTSSTVTSSTGGSVTATTPTTTTTGLPQNLLQTFAYKGFTGFMTVPNATYNFGKTLADGETLANPRLRVKNREKAKFNVGTRVPITTTSSPVGGGINVNVQYVDVGVKVNAEPVIQLNNDVNIKLSLEVSSIISQETVGGVGSLTSVVTIGTRNLDTVLSLKDGETSIIGGLIQDAKTKSKSKVFLLGDIPVIGPFLTSHDNKNNKNELVLAITPRIVRGITVPETDTALFWSGKEDEPSLVKPYASFEEPEDTVSPAAVPAPPAAKGAQAVVPGVPTAVPAPPAAKGAQAITSPVPAAQPERPTRSRRTRMASSVPEQPADQQATPTAPQPAVSPAAVPPAVPPAAMSPAVPPVATPPAVLPAATTPVVPPAATPQAVPSAVQLAVPPTATSPVTPPVVPPAVPPAGIPQADKKAAEAAVTVTPAKAAILMNAPPSVKVGEQFGIDVMATEAENVAGASLFLEYDPALVDFVDVAEGEFLKQGNVQTQYQSAVDRSTNLVTIILKRVGKDVGANGAGRLATVRFKALKPGRARYGFKFVYLYPPVGKSVKLKAPDSFVEVK